MKYLLLATVALFTFNSYGQKTYKIGDSTIGIIPAHTETIYEIRGAVKYQQLQGNRFSVVEVHPDFFQMFYVDESVGMIIVEDGVGNQTPLFMYKVVPHNGYKTYHVSNAFYEQYETSVYTRIIDINRAGYIVDWEDGNTKKIEYKITKKTFKQIPKTNFDESNEPKTHKETLISDTTPKQLRVHMPD